MQCSANTLNIGYFLNCAAYLYQNVTGIYSSFLSGTGSLVAQWTSHQITKDDLELLIFLLLPPDTCVPLCLMCAGMGVESRILCMLG